MAVDIDAAGGLILGRQIQVGQKQAAQQAGLAGSALADDQQLGLEQPIQALGLDFPEVVEHRLRPLLHDFRRRMREQTILHIDARSFPPPIRFNRQAGQNQ